MSTYRIHANARTTPKIRQEIQDSDLSIDALAEKYNVSRATIIKWRKRKSQGVEDQSHRPHRLRTTLSPVQEQLILLLREELLLSIDDLTYIAKEYIDPKASRSAIDRLLRREGMPSLRELMAAEKADKPRKAFKDYDPGFIHADIKYLPQMPDQDNRGYLFVAIDRASRWIYWEVHPNKEAATAAAFLEHLVEHCPFTIEKVLTDNGKEFTDRFCATGEREPTGNHPFDQACLKHQIEHRLIPPKHPQTNGMVERFNGRISSLLKQTHFASQAELIATLEKYTHLYLYHIPQRALNHKTPMQTLQYWYEKKPDSLKLPVNNLTGLDN